MLEFKNYLTRGGSICILCTYLHEDGREGGEGGVFVYSNVCVQINLLEMGLIFSAQISKGGFFH